MTRILKLAALLAVLTLVAIQAYRPDRTNPPSDPAHALSATMAVPPPVDAVLRRACYDCHSHETRWPWYSQVAPVSWRIASHVRDGRDELNFSTWGAYEPRRRARKLTEICEEVSAGNMPLRDYLLLHREAVLTPADVETLCAWTKAAASPSHQ